MGAGTVERREFVRLKMICNTFIRKFWKPTGLFLAHQSIFGPYQVVAKYFWIEHMR